MNTGMDGSLLIVLVYYRLILPESGSGGGEPTDKRTNRPNWVRKINEILPDDGLNSKLTLSVVSWPPGEMHCLNSVLLKLDGQQLNAM